MFATAIWLCRAAIGEMAQISRVIPAFLRDDAGA